MTRAAWESPPDSAFSGPALIRPWAMLEFLVNRGWLGLLNTSRAELPKTFAILLMASLVSRDLPPRLQRRASQWPTSLGRHRRGRARPETGPAQFRRRAGPPRASLPQAGSGGCPSDRELS